MKNKEYWDLGMICKKCDIPYSLFANICQKCGSRLDLCSIKYKSLYKWYNPFSWGRFKIIEWKDQ